MAYQYKEFTYASGDGKNHIAACLYTPKDRTVRGVVQIVHGMCDYMGRYQEMAAALCEDGFAVCGNDHLGHGKTAHHSDTLGYFAPEDGADTLVTDVHKLTLLMRSQFSGSPIFLVGHSMGSLIARMYVTSYYRDIDGVAFLGTLNNPFGGLARMLARMICRRKGPTYRSPFLNNLALGSYNKKIDRRDPSGCNWISRDDAVVTAYTIDPLCNFTFTASAYADLFYMVQRVCGQSYAQDYPKSLPTLIAAGDMDPVGNYGRAPRLLAARLSDAGTKDVTLKLYPGARHELHNETCRRAFFDDLLAWLRDRS